MVNSFPYLKNDVAEPTELFTNNNTGTPQRRTDSIDGVTFCPITINSKDLKCVDIALTLLKGFSIPIPLRPRSDKPTVNFHDWVENISAKSIREYWRKYPHHRVGYVKYSIPESHHSLRALKPGS